MMFQDMHQGIYVINWNIEKDEGSVLRGILRYRTVCWRAGAVDGEVVALIS